MLLGCCAAEKQMGGLKWLAVTGAGGSHLHDSAVAASYLADVFWSLFCPQCPGDDTAMAFLLIHCHERDVPLPLKLTVDLTMEEHCPLMVSAGGVTGLADCYTQCSRVKPHLRWVPFIGQPGR